MMQEDAERVFSDPTSSESDRSRASAFLLHERLREDKEEEVALRKKYPTLVETLHLLARNSEGREHVAYNELLIVLGEAKMKIKIISERLADEPDHLVHEINEHFSSM